jgi:hypothetical protein
MTWVAKKVAMVVVPLVAGAVAREVVRRWEQHREDDAAAART